MIHEVTKMMLLTDRGMCTEQDIKKCLPQAVVSADTGTCSEQDMKKKLKKVQLEGLECWRIDTCSEQRHLNN